MRPQPEQQAPPVQRLRVRYAKRGRARFTSHRDFGRAFERALEDADVVISTGGLGPTSDDLTTACVARLAGRELRRDPDTIARLEAFFLSRGGGMPENNRKQADFPRGSEIVPNARGTAPGFICPVERGGRTRHVICLPGVPHEMKAMVRETVVPWLAARSPDRRFASRVFSAAGIGESKLDELLAGVVEPGATTPTVPPTWRTARSAFLTWPHTGRVLTT